MENREGLLVLKAFKAPAVNDGGTLIVVRQYQPNDVLKRSDFDRFPPRSRRNLVSAGFLRDPLNVEIDQITQRPTAFVPPGVSTTFVHPKRQYDATGRLVDKGLPRGVETVTALPVAPEASVATMDPPKRKRGRPRKVRV